MTLHISSDNTPDLLRAQAGEAVKSGRPQQALGLLSAIPLGNMTDDDKALLVAAARAAHLEKDLVAYVREAKEDRVITAVEAARLLIMCREYLTAVPEDPRVQKLVSQCRAAIAKEEAESGSQGSVLTAAKAARYVDDSDDSEPVDLGDFSSIEPDAARILVLPNTNTYLSLDSLESLTAEAAAAFAGTTHYLSFDGISTIDRDTARELAKHRGELSLGSITDLSQAVAEALASHAGLKLSLGGLTNLPEDVAAALSRYRGTLEIRRFGDDLKLTVSAARALVAHDGLLRLGELESPSDEVCRTLERKARLELATVISPRLRALEKAIKAASPMDVLAVLQDFEVRERLSAEEHPNIPGGYTGPAEKAALGSVSVTKDGDAWLCKLSVMEMDEEFPCEELRAAVQGIVDACPEGAPVQVSVQRDTPGTDSECEYFHGCDMYGNPLDDSGGEHDEGDDDEGDDDEGDDDEGDYEGDYEGDDEGSVNVSEPPNKSQEIRKAATELAAEGGRPLPEAIIASLATRSIKVSVEQVMMVLRRMGMAPPNVSEDDDGEDDEAVISSVADLVNALSRMEKTSKIRIRVEVDGEVSGYMNINKVEFVDGRVEISTWD